MPKKHGNFSPKEKAQIALLAIKGEKTMAQISSDYKVHPTQIGLWKKHALDNLSQLFQDNRKKKKKKEEERQEELDSLYKLIGQRDLELDWLKKNYQLTHSQRVSLLEKDNKQIPLARQCQLLGISRSGIYYNPVISKRDKDIMDMIDAIYTEHPFYGNRRIKAELNHTHLILIGWEHVRTLMKKMAIEAIYPRKNLSWKDESHKVYPYLLRGVKIEAPDQVWSTDITYIRMETGFAYLIAVIDWFSRYVLSWKLSSRLDIDFVLECLGEALEQNKPEIFNTDQGSHFTSPKFTGILERSNVKISMDGRGRCLDNIFVERLWRTVKQENIYLNSYQTVAETRSGLNEYFLFYNQKRRHQSLDYLTPQQVYFQ